MMRPVRGLVLLAAVGAAWVACEDDGPPIPGTVTVSLETPNTDDGALAVTVRGPGITSLTPASSAYLVFWRVVSDDELRALVFGNVTRGPLFSLAVAEGRNPDRYSGIVIEVARQNDELRTDLSSYKITVSAPQ